MEGVRSSTDCAPFLPGLPLEPKPVAPAPPLLAEPAAAALEEAAGGGVTLLAPEVAGVAGFYRSFGSVATPFLTVSHDGLPWPLRQLRAARAALYRRLRPRLPVEGPGQAG